MKFFLIFRMTKKNFCTSILIIALLVAISTSCPRSITCPCGSSNKNYTHCLDDTFQEKPTCKAWSQCQTCKANVTHCITCPPKRIGPTCVEEDRIRKKRQSGSTCPDPGPIPSGYRKFKSGTPPRSRVFTSGQNFQYYCNQGYELRGNNVITCLSSGKWSSQKPTCKPARAAPSDPAGPSCSHPGVDVHGSVEGDKSSGSFRSRETFYPGEQLTYHCDDGYERVGSSNLVCNTEGKWSSSPPTCKETGRPRPRWPTLPSNPGYPQGPSVSGGTRPSSTPVGGDRKPCPAPVVDPNGSIGYISPNNGKYEFGTVVGFVCRSGYVMEGKSSINCRENGQWTSFPPTCRSRDSNCGHSLVQAEGKVTHGTNIIPGEYPWVVFLYMNETDSTCGGALLDRRTVLSAAHCFEYATYCTLYFGKYFRSDSRDDRYVESRTSSQIIIHPQYDAPTFDNDIAIIKFPGDVSFSRRIQPLCLPTTDTSAENIVPGKNGSVAGWGLDENQLQSDKLMLARLPVQSDETCMLAYEKKDHPLQITKGMFCAGFKNRKINVCKGDSGSPLFFYKDDTRQYTLEGLVSHGLKGNCDQPEKYSIFTKVSHYMRWINANWKK